MSAVDWHIEPGDRVLLEHTGPNGVPKRLHRTWATVLVANRATLDVKPDREGPRRVSRRSVFALTRPGH